ncbi:MFS transporter [Allorhizocola rhizosphaerae]|uniref:MFS transporter n=1 Tax=Allorhizocola rhizosphaerae TaxID=1872709 RepID=UPI000E3CFC89|nr:MFS transporter [Allorhizocola rhizosphaerae]
MPRLSRSPVTWLIYVQLGLYAYFLYGFGPVVGLLRDEQGVSNTLASLHSTALAVGAVLGGAAFALLALRFGRPRLIWGALAGIAVGIAGFVALPAWYPVTMLLTLIVAFFGTIVINGVVVSLAQLHGPAGPAAISEANAMAVGAGMIAPLVIGLSVGIGLGWRAGVGVLIGAIGIVALVAWRLGIVVPAREAVSVAPAGKLPLGRAYWLVWTMMVVTGAIEVVLSLWSAVVLRERAALTPAGASAAVSAILLGMLIGRAGGARLALRGRPIPLYFAALGVSLVGFAVFWWSVSPVPAIVGLLVVGVGNGMHYPLGIGLALSVSPEQPDRAAGVAAYGMGISFGLGPFVLGVLADEVGTHTAMLLVPVFLAAAAGLAWWLRASMNAQGLSLRGAS